VRAEGIDCISRIFLDDPGQFHFSDLQRRYLDRNRTGQHGVAMLARHAYEQLHIALRLIHAPHQRVDVVRQSRVSKAERATSCNGKRVHTVWQVCGRAHRGARIPSAPIAYDEWRILATHISVQRVRDRDKISFTTQDQRGPASLGQANRSQCMVNVVQSVATPSQETLAEVPQLCGACAFGDERRRADSHFDTWR
jgi:hypothetical protein